MPAEETGQNVFEPAGIEDVRAAGSDFLFLNPFAYLFLLPGPLFLVFFLIFKKSRLPVAALIFFSVFFLGLAGSGYESAFNGAIADFKTGFFKRALTSFKEAEKTTGPNAAIDYNIALCYYKLNKPGYAIHYLYRGMKLSPSLNMLNRLLTGIEEKWDLKNSLFPKNPVHPDLSFVLTVIFFNLVFVMLGFAIKLRKGIFAIVLIFLIVFTFSSLSVFLYNYFILEQKYGVVVSSNAVLKKIPLDKAEVWIDLKEGLSCYIKGAANGYILVSTDRGLTGWIKEGDLAVD
ncbi:MAG: hypothetical protein JW969_11840 [Spirochaetales bacterium]|nr:hypothetical protein [Spirochaetales bacterium]